MHLTRKFFIPLPFLRTCGPAPRWFAMCPAPARGMLVQTKASVMLAHIPSDNTPDLLLPHPHPSLRLRDQPPDAQSRSLHYLTTS